MTTLPIETIHVSEHNARQVAANTAADLELRASIEALGLLQPILVSRNGGENQYTLIAGHRRLAAAKALGWENIEALELNAAAVVTHDGIVARSAAENMVRKAMHPVDQWRAIVALTSNGYTLDGAAQALGLAPALARRLDHLGRMAPEVIDALAAEPELPDARNLRVIAMAPHDVQTKALAQATRRGGIDWHSVATKCERKRIPLSLAIFDAAVAGVVFEEDLFAEPGSDEQFTTTDVAGFIKAQKAALADRATASKGRETVIPWVKDKPLGMRLSDGWRRSWDPMPKRWKKDDPRHVFSQVVEDGWDIGKVESVVANPVERRAAASDILSDKPPAEPRPPISKASMNRLAGLKTEAVRERLPLVAGNENACDMLRALLLCLAFENVSLFDANSQYSNGPYRDLPHKLFDDAGQPRDLTEAELCTLAAETIARVVIFPGPDIARASGEAAEYLAVLVGAQMPRCDTEEILKGVSGDKLVELAREHGIDERGKVSDLRRRLVGHLPDWRPVDFGAVAPEPPDGLSDEMSDNDDEIAAQPTAAA